MTRRPCTFRKADVTRAAKAVQAAGLEVGFVEASRDGLIRVIPRNPVQPNPRDQVQLKAVRSKPMTLTTSLLSSKHDMAKIELRGIAKVTSKLLVRLARWTSAARRAGDAIVHGLLQ